MLDTLPGFRAFYPGDFRTRRALFEKWRDSLTLCGFEEYDHSVLEPLLLYKEKSGNEIVEQLFHFEDKGGREVALRPEMTPTLARMVGSMANSLRKPVKWFHVGDHFRYERMQKGRTRCFTQLNVDILGEGGVSADAESIYSLVFVCRQLGLQEEQFYIRLSDRNTWVLALEALGCDVASIPAILGVVDKIERASDEKTLAMLSETVGESAEVLMGSIRTLFEVKSTGDLRNWFNSHSDSEGLSDKFEQRLNDWDDLLKQLDALGCSPYFNMDLSIVRGLAYYTGFVFEAFEKQRKSRALAGGGRYDHLVEKLGGPSLPAVGWAMGDVTMADCLKHYDLLPAAKRIPEIFIASETAARSFALEVASKLREAGLRVNYSYKTSGLGKQIKEANQRDSDYCLMVGERELSERKVVCKNLSTGEESSFSEDGILEYFGVNS